jgi:DMSO/TMAO reductase YedYZ molybdopterin-dependent catalytic subunit
MHKTGFVSVFLLLVLVLTGCGSGAPKADWELGIGGAVSNPLTVSYGDLVKMEQVDLTDILMEKSTGDDVITSWSGVPVASLFEEAGAPAEWSTITAVAGDGYAIEISRDEMQDAIVALKDGGEWIATADPDHGPIRLVCPHSPANRWVFQLKEIQVNQ